MKGTTVGELVEMLAKFPFDTEIVVGCGGCQKGSVNDVITISDRTDQTFGYIELNVNQSWKEK
ncbi:hypothetical protein MKZ02_20205 [Pseudobacillus sp. FSL P4-0506]|uniref:hypothetical protein n=1 Tax=Pseudobacillus sp. FSL P4-0506 TaxID=2921576 RepID=UPI0030F4C6E3